MDQSVNQWGCKTRRLLEQHDAPDWAEGNSEVRYVDISGLNQPIYGDIVGYSPLTTVEKSLASFA